jgi:hypothetical protein
VPLLRTIARTVAVEVKVLSWSDWIKVGRQACRVTIPKGRRSGNPFALSFCGASRRNISAIRVAP